MSVKSNLWQYLKLFSESMSLDLITTSLMLALNVYLTSLGIILHNTSNFVILTGLLGGYRIIIFFINLLKTTFSLRALLLAKLNFSWTSTSSSSVLIKIIFIFFIFITFSFIISSSLILSSSGTFICLVSGVSRCFKIIENVSRCYPQSSFFVGVVKTESVEKGRLF